MPTAISGVSSPADQAAQQSASAAASGTLNQNFDTFLTLLTTQLQNQDPLEPLKSQEFTNQLVQFSAVEQSIATNSNLEQLLNLTFANFATDAVGYIGKEVVAESPNAVLTEGTANWGYELDGTADKVQLFVTDSAGRLVYSDEKGSQTGTNSFSWDGKDNNGRQLSDGTYSLRVVAQDANQNEVAAKMRQTGTVTAVEFDQDSPVLTVNGSGVLLSDVITVRDKPAATSGS
jgi:flagellar basal-body rod modification protein FlgD